ncbi:MAG: hypothetical protein JST67_02365 [Bacteroidetes bacterium]|nr:hypothetical protein [Bacteroidota bacterium]
MKKIIFISACAALAVIACSPKTKNAATTSANSASPTEEQMVTAAKTKYPNATLASFKQGHDVYYGAACTKCHNPKKISHLSEGEIPGVIADMAQKAKISDAERDAVLSYVTGVKIAGGN